LITKRHRFAASPERYLPKNKKNLQDVIVLMEVVDMQNMKCLDVHQISNLYNFIPVKQFSQLQNISQIQSFLSQTSFLQCQGFSLFFFLFLI
jgi:hypothetical protein